MNGCVPVSIYKYTYLLLAAQISQRSSAANVRASALSRQRRRTCCTNVSNDCSSGCALVQQGGWQPLAQPVLQLAAGYSASLGSLLVGALCEQQLVLYAWEPSC